MQASNLSIDEELIADLARLSDKPYDFVMWAWPWGEPDGELEMFKGPDKWQVRVLKELQSGLITFDQAIRIAIRSGHGVGKSAFIAMLIIWAIATVEDTRGRVTANTKEQLMRVLWGEVSKWHRLSICSHLFKMTATAIFSADPTREKTWRIDAIPWSEENPEAFAGLHNFGKRIIIVCDEASAVANVIWEVLDGATTDANTQIIWLVAGNPTRHSGRFRDCFERFSSSEMGPAGWRCYHVDSRESTFSNKTQIEAWRIAWGEDSDFFRVRVRGEFPNAEMGGLFPIELIDIAQQRPAAASPWDCLILGVDISRFGANQTVAMFRRGKDARTLPSVRWQGLTVVESAGRIAGLIAAHSPDAVFIDEGGVGGGVIDVLRSLGHSVIGVNFGIPASSRPNGILVANKRAEMYVAAKEWMREGGAIEPSPDLKEQLVAIEYGYNKKQEILLMAKADMKILGVASPDDADALVLTFAYPASKKSWKRAAGVKMDYDPLSYEAARGQLEVWH